jgi:hypothetical protein
MRVLCFVVPVIAYPVTYFICIELQGGGSLMGKRKRANVVVRTEEGEYIANPSDPRPGDGHEELDATTVPTFIIDEAVVVEAEEAVSEGGVKVAAR